MIHGYPAAGGASPLRVPLNCEAETFGCPSRREAGSGSCTRSNAVAAGGCRQESLGTASLLAATSSGSGLNEARLVTPPSRLPTVRLSLFSPARRRAGEGSQTRQLVARGSKLIFIIDEIELNW